MIELQELQDIESFKETPTESLQAIVDLSKTKEQELSERFSSKAHDDSKAILDGFAKKVGELTGIARNEGEKSSEYGFRAFSSFSDSKLNELKQKNDELEKKIKDGVSDEALKKELEKSQQEFNDLQEVYKKALETHQTELGAKSKELNDYKMGQALTGALPKLSEDLDEYSRSSRIEKCFADIKRDYELKFEDGKLVGVKDYQTKNVDELIKNHPAISGVLHEERKQKGGGASGGDGGGSAATTGDFTIPDHSEQIANSPNKLETLTKLMNAEARKQGISHMSPKFTEFQKAFVEKNVKKAS